MPKYLIDCKSYYRTKNGTFEEAKKTHITDSSLYEEKNGVSKIYGCGTTYELETTNSLNCINPWVTDKRLRIYSLPNCTRCYCPQNGSPQIEAELLEEGTGLIDIDWSFDYYQVLRLTTSCSEDEIKSRYKEFALKFHSDKYANKSEEEKRANHLRFTDIQKAYEVLGDTAARQRYDGIYLSMTFQCPGCTKTGLEKRQASGGGVVRSNSSLRYFHSQPCARTWNQRNGYSSIKVHNWTDDNSGGGGPKPQPKKNELPKRECAGCKKQKPFSRHFWARWSEDNKEDYCCTEKCLFDYWTRQGRYPNGKEPRQCYFCGVTKKKNNTTTWIKDIEAGSKLKGLIFCSKEHRKEALKKTESGLGSYGNSGSNINQERQDFIQRLIGLDGWDKLSNTEQDKFVKEVNNSLPHQFDAILARVESEIKKKNGDSHNNLKYLKNATIAEIDGQLLIEPEIKNSELEEINQNWGTDIQNATDENQVRSIKTRVLADIKNKRTSRQEESEIINLLAQAKNPNLTYEELAAIIEKIKKLRSSNAYQKHELEIDQQEIRLQKMDPDKYQKGVGDSLNNQLKNSGLNEDDISDETKKAIEEAKKDAKKKKQAEEAIAKDAARNDLTKLLNKIAAKIKKGNLTKKEREELSQEIQEFISKNSYQKDAYENQKLKVDSMLAELQVEKSGNQTSSKPFSLLIITLLVVSLLGLIITTLLIVRRKRQQHKIKP